MRVDMGEGERRTVSGAETIGLLGQLVCVMSHECVISQPLQVGQLLVGFCRRASWTHAQSLTAPA